MCKSQRKKYTEGEVTPQIESNSVYYNCLRCTPVLILAIRDSGSERNVIGGRLVCHPKTVSRCDTLIRKSSWLVGRRLKQFPHDTATKANVYPHTHKDAFNLARVYTFQFPLRHTAETITHTLTQFRPQADCQRQRLCSNNRAHWSIIENDFGELPH